jgi:hypothetical protein
MKKAIFSALLASLAIQQASAQAVIDTVSMGAGYVNNVWYSLENDNAGEASATNWDLGLAATISPASPLVASIIFNPKVGNVYEIPGSTPANFATVDTAGLSTWQPLDNSELDWSRGALNNTTGFGGLNYGWGTYDAITHTGVAANRVFVLKYTNGPCVKFYVNLIFDLGGKYTITFANLDNTAQGSRNLLVNDYAARNFAYTKLNVDEFLQREPLSANWDLLFTQYKTTTVPAPYNTVTGILHNVGVESAKVTDVNNMATYEDWQSATFSENINTIGYNWKTIQQDNSYLIAPSTVYFVKDKSGDIWKIIFTEFTGGSQGKSMFSKEKLETLGLSEGEAAVFTAAFPNPANSSFSMAVSKAEKASIRVYNLLGALCYETVVNGNQLQEVQIPVADLNNGLYQVVCTSNGQSVAQKIVVQH